MNTYLSIADSFNNFPALFKTVNLLQLKNIVISKHLSEEHIEVIKYKLHPTMIKNSVLYNYLRDTVDVIIVGTDGEDKHTLYVVKYAINHRIPIVLLTNLDYTYLEVI